MFIINSRQAAEDLLERRSLKYSARSPLIVLSNITKGLAMAFTNDKERYSVYNPVEGMLKIVYLESQMAKDAPC